MTDDPLDLQRFVDAQAPVYERVRTELRNGRKHSHWQTPGSGCCPIPAA